MRFSDRIKTAGGPGSGVTYHNTAPITELPVSPVMTIGRRTEFMASHTPESATLPLSRITHVAQGKYVIQKLARFLADREGSWREMPIQVLQVGDEYHLLDGHHRYLAACRLGIEELPAEVYAWEEEKEAELTDRQKKLLLGAGAAATGIAAGLYMRGRLRPFKPEVLGVSTQGWDNVSPDLFINRAGKHVYSGKSTMAEVQEIASPVSRIFSGDHQPRGPWFQSLRGSSENSMSRGVERIRRKGDEYALNYMSGYRDAAGRGMPIGIHFKSKGRPTMKQLEEIGERYVPFIRDHNVVPLQKQYLAQHSHLPAKTISAIGNVKTAETWQDVKTQMGSSLDKAVGHTSRFGKQVKETAFSDANKEKATDIARRAPGTANRFLSNMGANAARRGRRPNIFIAAKETAEQEGILPKMASRFADVIRAPKPGEESRIERLRTSLAPREPVESSNVQSVKHNRFSGRLQVQFVNGSVYNYAGVPRTTYKELKSAPSVGSYFHQNVRGAFTSEKARESDKKLQKTAERYRVDPKERLGNNLAASFYLGNAAGIGSGLAVSSLYNNQAGLRRNAYAANRSRFLRNLASSGADYDQVSSVGNRASLRANQHRRIAGRAGASLGLRVGLPVGLAATGLAGALAIKKYRRDSGKTKTAARRMDKALPLRGNTDSMFGASTVHYGQGDLGSIAINRVPTADGRFVSTVDLSRIDPRAKGLGSRMYRKVMDAERRAGSVAFMSDGKGLTSTGARKVWMKTMPRSGYLVEGNSGQYPTKSLFAIPLDDRNSYQNIKNRRASGVKPAPIKKKVLGIKTKIPAQTLVSDMLSRNVGGSGWTKGPSDGGRIARLDAVERQVGAGSYKAPPFSRPEGSLFFKEMPRMATGHSAASEISKNLLPATSNASPAAKAFGKAVDKARKLQRMARRGALPKGMRFLSKFADTRLTDPSFYVKDPDIDALSISSLSDTDTSMDVDTNRFLKHALAPNTAGSPPMPKQNRFLKLNPVSHMNRRQRKDLADSVGAGITIGLVRGFTGQTKPEAKLVPGQRARNAVRTFVGRKGPLRTFGLTMAVATAGTYAGRQLSRRLQQDLTKKATSPPPKELMPPKAQRTLKLKKLTPARIQGMT
jgi:hypothetical protein